MEIILRGVIENHTTAQLSKIGWDNQAAQTLDQSYDIATKSLAPYPAPHPPMLLNPRDLFSGNLECRAVPLHGRYRNTRNWVRWLHKNGVDIARPTEGLWSYHIFWPDWYSRHHPKVRHTFLHNSTCPTNPTQLMQDNVPYHTDTLLALHPLLLRMRSCPCVPPTLRNFTIKNLTYLPLDQFLTPLQK